MEKNGLCDAPGRCVQSVFGRDGAPLATCWCRFAFVNVLWRLRAVAMLASRRWILAGEGWILAGEGCPFLRAVATL